MTIKTKYSVGNVVRWYDGESVLLQGVVKEIAIDVTKEDMNITYKVLSDKGGIKYPKEDDILQKVRIDHINTF